MRKGQYFLISAIMFIGILTALTFSRGHYVVSNLELVPEILKNSIGEFSTALNSILYDKYSSENLEQSLRSYTNFQRFYFKKHGLNHKTYFLVGVPDGNKVNVTFGNFYGNLENLEISINSEKKYLWVNDTEIRTVVFDNVPEFFSVNLMLSEDGTPVNYTINTEKRTFYIVKLVADFKENHFEEVRNS